MKTLCSKISGFIKLLLEKEKQRRTTLLSDKTLVVKPRNYNIIYISLFLLVFLFFWYSIVVSFFNRFGVSFFFSNIPGFFTIIQRMITNVNWSYSSFVVRPMVETIQISVLGTMIGALLSVPFAILASQNIMGSKNPIPSVIKSFLSIIRTFPTLVYALILSYIFNYGTFIGVLATILFTFGIISKMLYEIIESLDLGSFIAIEATGANKLQSFRVAIVPQIIGRFYSIVLYSFEINLRSSAILGFVNAGGIGRILNDQMEVQRYGNVSVIVLSLLLVVLIVENVSQYLRRRLT